MPPSYFQRGLELGPSRGGLAGQQQRLGQPDQEAGP
jgi:hypothetical protein